MRPKKTEVARQDKCRSFLRFHRGFLAINFKVTIQGKTQLVIINIGDRFIFLPLANLVLYGLIMPFTHDTVCQIANKIRINFNK